MHTNSILLLQINYKKQQQKTPIHSECCLCFYVFAGNIILFKPRAACCFGEMSVPAGVPSCKKGEHIHRADLPEASNTGQ